MAINKKQTSVWMKVVLIFLAFTLVAGVAIPPFITGIGRAPVAPGAQTGAALERIAQTYALAIASDTAMLQTNPEDYDALVRVGNAYFDWGLEIRNSIGPDFGLDLPMWNAATVFYARALESQPGSATVGVDMAIAHFYGGDSERAIAIVGEVLVDSPEYAPAHLNAGVFFDAAGRVDDAIAAMERYLELEPAGANAQTARSTLERLRAGSAVGADPPGSATETPTP